MATLLDGPTEASRDTLVANVGQTPPRDPFDPGDNAGRYRILEKIGAGGMGVVYAAYDPKLDRRIALKILHARADGSLAERSHRTLLQEAQSMARLAHPNVVTVHDVGTLDKAVFIAMEYVVGQTLREVMDARAPDEGLEPLLDLFRQAGRGLAAAHAAGIVHRDFKPDNMIVGEEGRVRVLDFGLAHELAASSNDAEQTDPSVGAPLPLPANMAFDANAQTLHSYARGGTPPYMSPEQFGNARPDPRSDQYSFCVALYEGLYGRRPHDAESFVELYVAVTEGRIVQPPTTGPERSEIRAAVLRGLSLDPGARWPSMEALIAALEPPAPTATVPMRWRVLGFGLLASFAGLAAAQWPERDTEPPCQAAAAELAEVWGPDSRARVEAGLLAASSSYGAQTWDRVATHLDDYAGAWAAMHTQACEATELHHTQSEPLLDLRMACLDRRRDELGALVMLLAEADAAVVENAVSAVRSLPALARCADRDALLAAVPPPANAEIEAAVERLRLRLGQLDALRWAGRDRDARPIAEALLAEATSTGYLPLVVEVRLRAAAIDQELGDYERARERFETSYTEALGVGDEELATRASSRLCQLVGHHLQHAEGGLVWAKVARARNAAKDPAGVGAASSLSCEGLVFHSHGEHREALARHERAVALLRALPEHRSELSNALNKLAMSARSLGDTERAETIYTEVLALRRELYGASHPLVGSALHNISLLNLRRGQLEKALTLELEASELLLASLGEDAPRVSSSYGQLAVIYDTMGDWASAEPLYERALAGLRRQLGDSHPDVADAELNLGGGLFVTGDFDGATLRYERALAIYRSELGADHPSVATALTNLAQVEEFRERYAPAEALYAEALALLEARHGLHHPTLPFVLVGLGRAKLSLDDLAGGVAQIERALNLSAELLDDPMFHADLQFTLAQALHSTGRQRARSEDLARAAIAAYETLPQGQDTADEARSWLESP